MTTPAEVDDLTPGWFSEILQVDVSALELLDAHTGTTGRARVRITTDADIPETLFVKLQPFTQEQREFVRMVGMGVSEARFYAAVGDEIPVRIPKVWHSSFDENDGSFVMVLEDLEASGCRFTSAEDDDVLDVAESLMDELALLHSTYWRQDLPWLKAPSGYRNNAEGAKVAKQAAGFLQSAIDQFADDMPPEFRQLGELYIERFADVNALFREGDRTLVHGDDHIGNLFIDAAGRAGFYDWAIASMLPGMRDVAYFLTLSLPTEVRRREEDALLARYLGGMEKGGVTFDQRTIEDQYRLYSVYAWVGATSTRAMGSKWQPIEIGERAMVRVTEAIVDLDAMGLLNERLG